MKKGFIFLAALAAAMIAGATAGYVVSKNGIKQGSGLIGNFLSEASPHFTSYSPQEYPDLTYAAENAVKAVVNIDIYQDVERNLRNPLYEYFGIPENSRQRNGSDQGTVQQRRGTGSGVIISSDGYIVTNNHVIQDATKMRVTLQDGRAFDAKLIGTDPDTEVALIKIDATGLPVIPFGDSDKIRLGEWALAIGSPYELPYTITAGIISAKGRSLNIIDQGVESFIQTDAAVNPGNSGGALVNAAGELIGVNTLIASPTRSYIGYSFAIPSSIVVKVVDDLKKYGVVQRALLGISYAAVTDALIEELKAQGEGKDIDQVGGIYVRQVLDNSAADQAGIQVGDILTEINGVKITDQGSLMAEIARYSPNDKVKIIGKRKGQTKQFEVVLRNKLNTTGVISRDSKTIAETLGGKFEDISKDVAAKYELNGGVSVVSVDKGGLLAKMRIPRNFIITHINDQVIRSVNDLKRIKDDIQNIEGINPNGRTYRIERVRE